MLTDDQEKWLQHLSNSNKITIIPYNPKVKEVFQKVKSEIQSLLGGEVEVVHRGASNLGISGKGEIDIYIPINVENFKRCLEKLVNVYGNPGSLYPNERVRFNCVRDGIEIEIFLVHRESESWKIGSSFEDALKKNNDLLIQYETMKRGANGCSTREYYRRKLAFMNQVLSNF